MFLVLYRVTNHMAGAPPLTERNWYIYRSHVVRFWRIHMSWKLIYVLLLLHAPARLWIWFFFPALFVLVDRLLLANNQSIYLTLRSVKLLPRDVIGLTFELPQGFAYQAGPLYKETL